MIMKCKVFQMKIFTPWEKTLQSVCDFATRIGRERIVNISNTSDRSVTVWYWEDVDAASDSSSSQPKK